MDISIKKLQTSEWQKYKDLRLEALADSPTAFGSSAEEEAKRPDEYWRGRIDNGNHKPLNLIIFAEFNGELIGMVGAFAENKVKIQHIADVWGMYVKSKFRGQGVGKFLLESLLNELRASQEIKKIKIAATSTNQAAVGLYEKLGFQVVGELKKELLVDGEYYDELLLEMYLD